MKVKAILSLLVLSGLLPSLAPQAAWSGPEFPDAFPKAKETLLTQTAQASTRTIEYQWPRIENAHTSFDIPSNYRAVTYDAGINFIEGHSYNDVHILVLSPEEYNLWQRNPSQGPSLGIAVNRVFDKELYWMMDVSDDAIIVSWTNQNGHRVDIYRVGGAGNYIGLVWGGPTVEITFQERHVGVAEMILDSFDYL